MGYEFASKEIRAKFKKTKLGKKLNKILYIFLIIAVVLLIGSVVNFIFGNGNLDIFIYAVTLVAWLSTVYFDGKRDGAIAQFKENKDK